MDLYPTVTARSGAYPLLPRTPHLHLQQRLFSEGSEFSHLVRDTFQLFNDTDTTQNYLLLPTTELTLLFLFTDVSATSLLCGPMTSARSLELPQRSTVYCLRLRCGCGDWLTDRDLSSLTDRVTPLAAFAEDLPLLQQQLAESTSFQQRNAHIFHWLDRQGGRSYQSMAMLRRCLALIEQHNGQITVSELAQAAGCSERYLSRVFRRRVGVSTKTQCELVQLHHSLQTMQTASPKSLLHIAVACGYFDQAHMNRHYRRFLHCSASEARTGQFPQHAPSLLSSQTV